jgi:hypothetical protein
MFSQGGMINEEKFTIGVFDSTDISFNGASFPKHDPE